MPGTRDGFSVAHRLRIEKSFVFQKTDDGGWRGRAHQVGQPFHHPALDFEAGLAGHQECHGLVAPRQRLERQDQMTAVAERHRIGRRKAGGFGARAGPRRYPVDPVRLRHHQVAHSGWVMEQRIAPAPDPRGQPRCGGVPMVLSLFTGRLRGLPYTTARIVPAACGLSRPAPQRQLAAAPALVNDAV